MRKADLAIGRSGIDATETATSAPVVLDEGDIELPDLLTDLQDKTQLTRRSLVRILTGSGRLDDFKRNPQEFVELVTEAINRTKRLALVDGIKYQRIGDEYYYAQEFFETGGADRLPEEHARREQVRFTSTSSTIRPTVERAFAEQLEKNEAVKVYAKLPGWFKVPTPLGTYNPDWAVLVEIDGAERLYFVVETKSELVRPTTCATRRAPRSSAVRPTSRPWPRPWARNPPKFVKARNIADLMGHVERGRVRECRSCRLWPVRSSEAWLPPPP